jgi:GST-like protein
MGSAPYVGGGFGHFYAYAPEKLQYPIDRFTLETKRQLDVLDKRLAHHEYLAGEQYSIADIATYPWYGALVKGRLYDAAEFLNVAQYSHLQRWADAIEARPAVARGRRVNNTWDDNGVAERHCSADLD